jgi:asparagine synthase (glutamine-hydrolysing)
MISTDQTSALVYNGEIYNYVELRDELLQQGVCFRSTSDTEVLLYLYNTSKRKGSDPKQLLHRLNGMFAFALWDADAETLWLARDAFGIKPLYYSTTSSGFFFASEIKALIAMGVTPGPLDAASLDRYLSFLWCPGEGTPVSNIHKLGPGQLLRVKEGQIVEHTTWAKRTVARQHKVQPATVRETLRKAVHRQMVSDVPVGAFLSGGLDSTSVACFAREVQPNLPCFTIQTKGAASEGLVDDLPFARMAAEHLKVPLEVVRVDAEQMAHSLEAMIWQLDEPLADPAPLNVLFICQAARTMGIKVLLSGTAGDDLFSGYRRHLALQRERYWSRLPYPLRSALQSVTQHLPVQHAFARRLRKAFSGATLSDDERMVHYFRWIDRKDLQSLYTPAFRERLGKANTSTEQPLLDYLRDMPPEISPLTRMLALEQRFFLSDHNLIYTDKMSMQAGVEVRVPFLDPDLVALAAQVPDHHKQHGREGKWILKKAMEPLLPREIIYRPKTGFGAPLRHWLRHELREWMHDLLSEKRVSQRGIFEPSAVQSLIKANEQGRVDASYTLFSMICIEVWCQRFMSPSESVPIIDPFLVAPTHA